MESINIVARMIAFDMVNRKSHIYQSDSENSFSSIESSNDSFIDSTDYETDTYVESAINDQTEHKVEVLEDVEDSISKPAKGDKKIENNNLETKSLNLVARMIAYDMVNSSSDNSFSASSTKPFCNSGSTTKDDAKLKLKNETTENKYYTWNKSPMRFPNKPPHNIDQTECKTEINETSEAKNITAHGIPAGKAIVNVEAGRLRNLPMEFLEQSKKHAIVLGTYPDSLQTALELKEPIVQGEHLGKRDVNEFFQTKENKCKSDKEIENNGASIKGACIDAITNTIINSKTRKDQTKPKSKPASCQTQSESHTFRQDTTNHVIGGVSATTESTGNTITNSADSIQCGNIGNARNGNTTMDTFLKWMEKGAPSFNSSSGECPVTANAIDPNEYNKISSSELQVLQFNEMEDYQTHALYIDDGQTLDFSQNPYVYEFPELSSSPDKDQQTHWFNSATQPTLVTNHFTLADETAEIGSYLPEFVRCQSEFVRYSTTEDSEEPDLLNESSDHKERTWSAVVESKREYPMQLPVCSNRAVPSEPLSDAISDEDDFFDAPEPPHGVDDKEGVHIGNSTDSHATKPEVDIVYNGTHFYVPISHQKPDVSQELPRPRFQTPKKQPPSSNAAPTESTAFQPGIAGTLYQNLAAPTTPKTTNKRPSCPSMFMSRTGLITVLLNCDMSVEMTIDHIIRIVSHEKKLALLINEKGSTSYVYHSAGRIMQDVAATEAHIFLNRRVKFTADSVLFANTFKCFEFDGLGIKESECRFAKEDTDMSIPYIFGTDDNPIDRTGDIKQGLKLISRARLDQFENGSLHVKINGIRITQTSKGDVTVMCGPKFMRVSPSTNEIHLKTNFVEMRIAPNWHITIQCEDYSMSATHATFSVSNGMIEAGFDRESRSFAVQLPNRKSLLPRKPRREINESTILSQPWAKWSTE